MGSVPGSLHASSVHYYVLQVNYLIDEEVNTGKGANNIISMLYPYQDIPIQKRSSHL